MMVLQMKSNGFTVGADVADIVCAVRMYFIHVYVQSSFLQPLNIKMTRKKRFSKIKYLNRSDDSMNKIHGNICCK